MEYIENDGPTEVIYMPSDISTKKDVFQKQLRVAAYCRVSTESDEQTSSYEAQQKYYKDKITENPNWRLIAIYGEEISGTRAEKRTEFMKMIRQCRKKKIDLVITKSISRFARNTMDSLKYIRELKELGIAIIFEKENINTLDAKSEVIITILSSLAQEESNSISGNVKMGKRMAMKEGKVDFRPIYGYRLDENKQPQIVEQEAEIVQKIFKEYIKGKSIRQIQSLLAENNIPAPSGKAEWTVSTLQGLIENEKYCGDVLMQKTYVLDPISKKTRVNHGELPKVLVKNNHRPIISREMFRNAELERTKRSAKRKVSQNTKTQQGKFSSKYSLTDILVCGDCNTPYRRTTWARNGEKKVVWRCINRLENGTKYCTHSPTLNEEILQQAIITAMNTTRQSRLILLPFLKEKMEQTFTSRDGGLGEISNVEEKIKNLTATTMEIVNNGVDISEHLEQLTGLNNEIKSLQMALDEMKCKAEYECNVSLKMTQVIDALQDMQNDVTYFDESLIRQSVEMIKVINAEKIQIRFKDGFECEQTLVNYKTNQSE